MVSIGIDVNKVAEELSEFIPTKELLWASSEADELGANLIILAFKVGNCRFINRMNIILRYLPLISEVLWMRVEIIISSDLPAKDFLTRIYNELIRSGAEVAVKKDSISAIYKLNLNSIRESIKSVINNIKEILGCSSLEINYLGFEVMNIG